MVRLAKPAPAGKDAPPKGPPPSVVGTAVPPEQTPTPESHLPSTAVTAGVLGQENPWSRKIAKRGLCPEAAELCPEAAEFIAMTADHGPSASAVQGAAVAEVAVASVTAGEAGAAVTAGVAEAEEPATAESVWSESIGLASPVCLPLLSTGEAWLGAEQGFSDVTGPDLAGLHLVDDGFGGVTADSHFAPMNGPDGRVVPDTWMATQPDPRNFTPQKMRSSIIQDIKRDMDSLRDRGQVR